MLICCSAVAFRTIVSIFLIATLDFGFADGDWSFG